jgi:hypothetical protein
MKLPAQAAAVVPLAIPCPPPNGPGLSPSPGMGCSPPNVWCYCVNTDMYVCCSSTACTDKNGPCRCGTTLSRKGKGKRGK